TLRCTPPARGTAGPSEPARPTAAAPAGEEVRLAAGEAALPAARARSFACLRPPARSVPAGRFFLTASLPIGPLSFRHRPHERGGRPGRLRRPRIFALERAQGAALLILAAHRRLEVLARNRPAAFERQKRGVLGGAADLAAVQRAGAGDA